MYLMTMSIGARSLLSATGHRGRSMRGSMLHMSAKKREEGCAAVGAATVEWIMETKPLGRLLR